MIDILTQILWLVVLPFLIGWHYEDVKTIIKHSKNKK
jgi:hypothetical protein